MKTRILLLAALIACSTVYSQGWQKVYEGGIVSFGVDAIPTDDGGYITLGDFTVDNPPPQPADHSLRLIKTDASGEVSWESILPGQGSSLEYHASRILPAAADGYYVLADEQAGNKTRILLIRYNEVGDTLWTKRYERDSPATIPATMIEYEGNLLIVGYFAGVNTEEEGLLFLYVDENGEVIWEKVDPWENENWEYSPIQNIIPLSSGGFVGAGSYPATGKGHVMRLDEEGNILWAQEYAFTEGDTFWDIEEGSDGNLYICGNASGIAGLSPLVVKMDTDGDVLWYQVYNHLGQIAVNMVPAPGGGFTIAGSRDHLWWTDIPEEAFVMKIDDTGEELWYTPVNDGLSSQNSLRSIALANDGGYITAGESDARHLLVKLNAAGHIYTSQLNGYVRYDQIENCEADTDEPGLAGWLLELQGTHQSYFTATDENGYYEMTVDTGAYTLQLVHPNNFWQACENGQTISIDQMYDTLVQDIMVQATVDCPQMTVDVSASLLRRCFDNTYVVQYCNIGPVVADTLLIEVKLDPYLSLISSEIPATSLGNNTYSFDLGTIPYDTCGSFQFVAYLDCDSTVLGQVHCVEASAITDTCSTGTADIPTIELESGCEADSAVFILRNISGEDMQVPGTYIVIEDDVMYAPVPYDLDAGDSLRVSMPATGSTYRLEARRFPDSFNDEYISQTVEGCSDGEFSTGFVNQFPLFTGSPSDDIDCQENIGAYDPNDKRAFPLGYGEDHYIKPNTSIDYHIRFQNTGTDTAFTVVIKDTLSPHLNPATIRVGAASHDYKWSLEGQGILTFTFENIMLPDSNINEPASHGFVRFSVDPFEELDLGTRIENQAAIYFDFNEPIFTNTAFHVIQEDFIQVINDTDPGEGTAAIHVSAYPNPARDRVTLSVSGLPFTNGALMLYNTQGQLVHHQLFDRPEFELDASALPEGMYFFQLEIEDKPAGSGRIIIQ